MGLWPQLQVGEESPGSAPSSRKHQELSNNMSATDRTGQDSLCCSMEFSELLKKNQSWSFSKTIKRSQCHAHLTSDWLSCSRQVWLVCTESDPTSDLFTVQWVKGYYTVYHLGIIPQLGTLRIIYNKNLQTLKFFFCGVKDCQALKRIIRD